MMFSSLGDTAMDLKILLFEGACILNTSVGQTEAQIPHLIHLSQSISTPSPIFIASTMQLSWQMLQIFFALQLTSMHLSETTVISFS